jgi:hypothetical protein
MICEIKNRPKKKLSLHLLKNRSHLSICLRKQCASRYFFIKSQTLSSPRPALLTADKKVMGDKTSPRFCKFTGG